MYASVDAADPDHARVVETLSAWPGELVVSTLSAVEADYLILRRLGVDAELLFLEDLTDAYLLEGLDTAGVRAATGLCRRYRDLELGLADASIVVLAERWSTRSIATFDERHFRAVAPLQGGSFSLLPADSR